MVWPFGSTSGDGTVHTARSSRTAPSRTLSGYSSSGSSAGRRLRKRSQSASGLPSNDHATWSSRLTGGKKSNTGRVLDAGRTVRRSLSRGRKPKSTWETTVDWLSYAGSTAMTAGCYVWRAATYTIQSTVGWAGRMVGTFREGMASSRESSREEERGRSHNPRGYPPSSQESGTVRGSAATRYTAGRASLPQISTLGPGVADPSTASWVVPQ